MVDKNITEFPEASNLLSTDIFHISQGGVDKKIPATLVLASIEGGNPFEIIPVEETNTTRTITLNDKDKFIQCLNNSGCVVTLPSQNNAPFDIGDKFTVKNDGVGTVTFNAEAGVTIRQSSIGLSMPEQGQAATFVNVGPNIWNMISGGGGSVNGTQRFKVTRTSLINRVGTGTANLTIDPILQVTGLTEGSTYKVDCMISISSGSNSSNTFIYRLSSNATLQQSDYLTHLTEYTGGNININNDPGTTSPLNTIGVLAASNSGSARVSGEITIPAGESSIALYWDTVESGADISIQPGSSLL